MTHRPASDASMYYGPAWNNSTEYAGLDARELTADIAEVSELLQKIEALGAQVAPFVARAEALSALEVDLAVRVSQEAAKHYHRAMELLYNVDTFLHCELSVDGQNAKAKTLSSRIQVMQARLAQVINPVSQFLMRTTDETAERYLSAPHTAPERYEVTRSRTQKVHALSLPEEDLLIAMSVDGPTAWGTLYDNLAGSIKCVVAMPDEPRTMGLAEAASLSQNEDERVRRSAYEATGRAWETHEEAASAVLNSLAGWRLETYRRRSHTKRMHFLDSALFSYGIKPATLDAMMAAVKEARPLGQRVLRLQAKALGKDRLGPWDLFAPCPQLKGKDGSAPTWKKPTFAEAIDLIAKAYGSVDPAMGDFVRMMADKGWIEGRVGPNKRPGAYCTSFPKSRQPRVYMTYAGGMKELKTLAHEIGHALHSWVMRDMPYVETFYPMTLAETASIFGETVVNGLLVETAKTPADRFQFLWAETREVESFLLNIPARFTFEKAFYERRADSVLNPEQLKQLMSDAWQEWYGDALSEVDPMFWARKLHFSISSLSFYNFPYTFGYLFALGVYAQRARLGADFYRAYVALLRDTGRMPVEDVASRHLCADLTHPDFWRQSIAIAQNNVDAFESAVLI